MKRFLLLFLLLALLLSLTGCFTITGDTTDTSPEGKQTLTRRRSGSALPARPGPAENPRPSVPTLSASVARRPRA